jgi:acetyl-CoA synthetase
MARAKLSTYEELYKWSIGTSTRSDYWEHAIEQLGVAFETRPNSIFDVSEGVARATYLPGANLNVAKSCFNKRDPSDVAIVYANESEPTTLRLWTYAELDALSNQVASSLAKWGLTVGSAVGVCMTMTPESVAIYLGMVKGGVSVVSIADSFSSIEIATRLRLAGASGIFVQDVIFRGAKYLTLFERVVEAVASVDQEQKTTFKCCVVPGSLSTDGTWGVHPSASELFRSAELDMGLQDFLALSGDEGKVFEPISLPSSHAVNILFSSGTTGVPKAIVWSGATAIKAAADGMAHQDIKKGDIVCWPTSPGWMMSSWSIYATFFNGATLALFNGIASTGDFCRFVELAKVSMLGVVPSLVKSWRSLPGTWPYDWSAITRFSSTGEASDPSTYHFLMSRVPGYAPVIEYCGGTEIGGSFLSSTVVQPNAPSMFSSPVLGSQIFLYDDAGTVVSGVGSGEVVLVPPTVGYSTRLLNFDHYKTYYEGMHAGPGGEVLRRHGDEIEACVIMTQAEEDLLQQATSAFSPEALEIARRTEASWRYFRALGRTDDTMNLGGIKVSSVEIERVCNLVENVHETAAIAVNPEGGGPSMLVVYVVLKPGAPTPDTAALKVSLQASIKTKLNPLFHITDVVLSSLLPRTASNKIMRRVLRDQYTAERKSGGGGRGSLLARSATYNASVTKLLASTDSLGSGGGDSPRG